MLETSKARSRFPKVDTEFAGTAMHDLLPRCVCLLREEYISLFHFGHNIRVSLDLLMEEALAIDEFTHLDEVRWNRSEADHRVPRLPVALKPLELDSTLHE
jgi:hypothetical protein